MIERNNSKMKESEAAFAVCMALMNVLILAATGGLIWLMFLVINETSSINAIILNRFLP